MKEQYHLVSLSGGKDPTACFWNAGAGYENLCHAQASRGAQHP